MRRLFTIIAAGVLLAGCAGTKPDTAAYRPIVTVAGPIFPATQFDCGARPVPPDPATAGNKAGSAAAHYENRLGAWGQGCQNRLTSTGAQLNDAGQVAK